MIDSKTKLKVKIKKKLELARENRQPPNLRLLSRMLRLEKLLKCSVVNFKNKQITLSSGRKSSIFFNCKPTLYTTEGQFLVGHVINQFLVDQNIKAIGGPARGADPIALAACTMSNFYKNKLNAFSVNLGEVSKDCGIDDAFCGFVFRKDNVIVIDDVLTTGNSLRDTILICEAKGLIIKKIIVLIDRQEGGKEVLETLGYTVQSLYTARQLVS